MALGTWSSLFRHRIWGSYATEKHHLTGLVLLVPAGSWYDFFDSGGICSMPVPSTNRVFSIKRLYEIIIFIWGRYGGV